MFLAILLRLCLSFLCISTAACQCAFPSQLIGVWKGADRGDMTFVNSTYIQFYSVTIPRVPHFHFICQEQQANKYFLKAEQENNIFGVIVKFYMCIELHSVDGDIAYYYQLTEHDPYLQDNMVGDGLNTANFDNVCSRTLVTSNFITLVRDGSIADGSLNITCPEALQAQFGNVSIQHEGEAEASTCPDTVFDVCTDKTLINITYNATCTKSSTDKTLSDLGVYRCIHAITDGSDTYLSVWNDDFGVANPFNCFAFRRIGEIIYATETPKFCSNTTTSSVAETGGVKLVIWDIIGTCEVIVPTTTEAPPNLAGLYALLVLPFVLLLFLAILLGRYCYRKYGCICMKIKLPKRKKKPPPIVDDGTGKPDVVGKITFVPSVIKPAKLYNFRPKKQLNFFPLFDPEWTPSNIQNLQPVAKVEPLYKDTLDDYMKGRLPRRPSGVSLYSFHSGRISNGNVV